MKRPRYIYHVFVANNEENSIETSAIFIRHKEAKAFVKKSEELEPSDEIESVCIEQIATRKDVLLAEGDQFYESVLLHLGKEITAVLYPFKNDGKLNVEKRFREVLSCIRGAIKPDAKFSQRFGFEPDQVEFLRCITGTPMEGFYTFPITGVLLGKTSVSLKKPSLLTNKFGAWLYAMCTQVTDTTFATELRILIAGRCRFDGPAIIEKGVILK